MQAPLFDTHAHLDEPSLAGELETLIAAANNAELTGILTIGTTKSSSEASIEMAEQYPQLLHAAVGIHPNYAQNATDDDWSAIVEMANKPVVKAIGETGLDRYWDHCPIEIQQDYFRRHLALTRKTGKPFIVHCRDAEEDVMAMLEEDAKAGELSGVMHSFCGSREAAQKCVDWGMMISFSGMLTFKRNEELREIAAAIPEDRLMVETDAPYLAPMPYRGKRNQPAYVKHTAEVLADCRNMTYKEVCQLTTANADRFLGINND